MQFIDLQKQYQSLKQEIDEAILKVLNSCDFIMGQEVQELEDSLAEYVSRKYCVTCANGTDAISLALMAYNIRPGDAVFLPTFTFYATAEAVSLCGATPIFVDIDEETFNISTTSLQEAIRKVLDDKKLTPKAIISVDLFGLPAEFDSINQIGEKYNLLIIEDAAQGFGGAIRGKKACSFGNISTTSFFPAKPLGCYGDGGAVFTDEKSVKDTLESLRVHGKGANKYENVRIGRNSRLDTLQAAILQVKLKAFKEYELLQRQKIAAIYDELLNNVLKTPQIPPHYTSSFAQYSVLLKSEIQRDELQKKLKAHGIPSMVYYLKSMHQQSVYNNNISVEWKFPVAEQVSQKILSLPIHPYIETGHVEKICEIIIEELKR